MFLTNIKYFGTYCSKYDGNLVDADKQFEAIENTVQIAKKYLEAMQKPINYRGNNTSEPVNYDIAFVVDKSGSMNGERIRRAKSPYVALRSSLSPQRKKGASFKVFST